jgi:hypothetical protein
VTGIPVTFRWKVSSEEDYDFLEFLVSGTVMTSISGEQDWQERVFEVPAGANTLTWRYVQDASVKEGYSAGWLDSVVWEPGKTLPDFIVQSITLNPATVPAGHPITYTVTVRNQGEEGGDAVGAPHLLFTTGGDAEWFIQPLVKYDGEGAAQSGAITHNQQSWLKTVVTGPGTISFQRWSQRMDFTTPSHDPAPPVPLAPLGDITETVPVFTWETATNAQWYRVFVRRDADAATVMDRWTQDTSLPATQPLNAGGYTWWVGSWNDVAKKTVWSSDSGHAFTVVPE